jgi:gallate decarboxylase subunit D
MHSFLSSKQKGRFELRAHVTIMGNDILVVLLGGSAHIGAVAMAEPRPSLADPRKAGATSSVYTYVGHKEDMIAKTMAEKLAKDLNRKAVVVAGIHWDNLKEEEIAMIVNMCPEITEDVMNRLPSMFLDTKV